MLPTFDETSRSLRAACGIIQRPDRAVADFDHSPTGYRNSFGVILLTVPAAVAALAAERVLRGLPRDSALFADPGLVLAAFGAHAGQFLVFPLALLAIARLLHLEDRWAPGVVAHNWASALAVGLFALPALLLALDWATPALATLYTAAFAVIVLRLKYQVARAALGLSAGLAAALSGVALVGEIAVFNLFRALA